MKKKLEYTEIQKVQIIRKIAKRLSEHFTLGYLLPEDIEQECFILGWQGLKKYNGEHPLEHFLYVHIRNRFLNLIRNKVRRKDPPCYTCHAAHLEPELFKPDHQSNQFCKKYLVWMERNNTKSLLMHTLSSEDFDIEQRGDNEEICPEFKQGVLKLLEAELEETDIIILRKLLNGKNLRGKTLQPFIERCQEIIKERKIGWEDLNGYS